MDEEFFFPQNVKTTYRIFGMGPRHLRRAVVGLPFAVAVAVLVARWHFLWGVLAGTILAAVYVAACCWPTSGEDAVFDLWLHVRRVRKQQSIFVKEEVRPGGAVQA